MAKVLGIDPGLDGGLVLLEGSCISELVVTPTMPGSSGSKREYDLPALRELFLRLKPDHVFLEKAQAMPGQGVTSMFTIGHGYGLLRGLIVGIGVPHTLVHPRTWQKVLFQDVAKDDTKKTAALVCGRLWPAANFKASSRCKKMHEGLCDAVLIAEYGRRTL